MSGRAECSSVVVADGKILLAGRTKIANDNWDVLLLRYLADGTLDTSFNGTGMVIADLDGQGSSAPSGTVAPGSGEVVSDVAVMPDGKILVAGGTGAANDSRFLARFTSSGVLDPSFHSTGMWILGDAVASGRMSLEVLPDGRVLILVGATFFSDSKVLRLGLDGTLDTGFGTGGELSLHSLFSSSRAEVLKVQADGKFLIGGALSIQAGVSRYTADGILDLTFGQGGSVVSDPYGGARGYVADVQVLADGKAVLYGELDGGTFPRGESYLICRLNADGTLDRTLRGNGYVVPGVYDDYSVDRYPRQLSVGPGGDIVTFGRKSQSGQASVPDFVRLLENGTRDREFNLSYSLERPVAGVARLSDGTLLLVKVQTHSSTSDIILETVGFGISLQPAAAPVMVAPAKGMAISEQMTLQYHLPQKPQVGSVTLTFTSGPLSQSITLGTEWEKPGFNSGIVRLTERSELTLLDGSYDVSLSYRDLSGALSSAAVVKDVYLSLAVPSPLIALTSPKAAVVVGGGTETVRVRFSGTVSADAGTVFLVINDNGILAEVTPTGGIINRGGRRLRAWSYTASLSGSGWQRVSAAVADAPVDMGSSTGGTTGQYPGNLVYSRPVSILVDYPDDVPLNLSSGPGKITFLPALKRGSKAVIGQTYKVTVKANSGYRCDSIMLGSNGNALVVKGGVMVFTFTGNEWLSFDFTNGVLGSGLGSSTFLGSVTGNTTATQTQANSGRFTATLGQPSDAVTGKLVLDGVTWPFAGVFAKDNSSLSTPIPLNGVSFDLAVHGGDDISRYYRMGGTATKWQQGVALAVIPIDAAITGRVHSSLQGSFNLHLSAPKHSSTLPHGTYPNGVGSCKLTVSQTGSGWLTGKMADGSVLLAGTRLCLDGRLPVFAQLNRGTGTLVGTMEVAPHKWSNADVWGEELLWFQREREAHHFPFGYGTGMTVSAFGAKTSASTPAAMAFGTTLKLGIEVPGQPETVVELNKSGISYRSADRAAVITFNSTGSFQGQYASASGTTYAITGSIVRKGMGEALGFGLSKPLGEVFGSGTGVNIRVFK